MTTREKSVKMKYVIVFDSVNRIGEFQKLYVQSGQSWHHWRKFSDFEITEDSHLIFMLNEQKDFTSVKVEKAYFARVEKNRNRGIDKKMSELRLYRIGWNHAMLATISNHILAYKLISFICHRLNLSSLRFENRTLIYLEQWFVKNE